MVAVVLLVAADLIVRAPTTVRQGDTFRVEVNGTDLVGGVLKAPWKEVPVFRGSALLPVPVRQEPGKYTVSLLDARREMVRELWVTVTDAKFSRQNVDVSPGMATLKTSDEERDVVEKLLATVSEERFWTEPFRIPTSGCMNGRFGVLRFHNGVYSGRFHGGIDQRGATGTPVRAVASGTVGVAGKYVVRGGTVGINHGQGMISMYLHLSSVLVKPGQKVQKGDLIGRIGGTGFATGPHLHWSIYVHGVPVNPLQWTPGVRACSARLKKK